jgi:hypothetical protein
MLLQPTVNRSGWSAPLPMIAMMVQISGPKIFMISFFQWKQIFFRGFAFLCNFVRNRIYCLVIKVFTPVMMVRDLHISGCDHI